MVDESPLNYLTKHVAATLHYYYTPTPWRHPAGTDVEVGVGFLDSAQTRNNSDTTMLIHSELQHEVAGLCSARKGLHRQDITAISTFFSVAIVYPKTYFDTKPQL